MEALLQWQWNSDRTEVLRVLWYLCKGYTAKLKDHRSTQEDGRTIDYKYPYHKGIYNLWWNSVNKHICISN